ncbi:RING-type domain-containing protein [Entamoeba marina]
MSEFTCKYCNKQLQDPVTLTCSHSFCIGCIRSIFKKDNVCPTCQKPFGRPFKVDTTLQNRIQHYNSNQEIPSSEPLLQKSSSSNSSPLLSLPEYTLIELLRSNPIIACGLSTTCKYLNTLANKEEVWMDGVLLINPQFKHQIGTPWKQEYIKLSTRKACYLRGTINDYEAKTILNGLDKVLMINWSKSTNSIDILTGKELIRISNDNLNRYQHQFNVANQVSCRGNMVTLSVDNTFYKYHLIHGVITQYSPINPIVKILQTSQDLLITKHSLLVVHDDGSIKETSFPNLDIKDAFIVNTNKVVLVGIELNKYVGVYINEIGEIIQQVEFPYAINEEIDDDDDFDGFNDGIIVLPFHRRRRIRLEHVTITIKNNVVYLGRKYWLPGKEIKDIPNGFHSVICLNNKEIPYKLNAIKYNRNITELSHNINDYAYDAVHDYLYLIDDQSKMVSIFKPNGQISLMRIGSVDEKYHCLCVNPYDFKIYVAMDDIVRAFTFGK